MADIQTLATDVSNRLIVIAERGALITRGVAFLTTAAVGLAYLVGLLIFPTPWLWAWLVVGLVLGALPVVAIWRADRRLRRVPRSIADTITELRGLMSDRTIRTALIEVVDHADDRDAKASLIGLGRDLNNLRAAVAPKRENLQNLWQNISAITSLPGLLALAIVGSFAAMIFSVVVVVANLLI